MYLVLLSTLLILGTIPIKGCITNLNGDSGEFSINETYLSKPSNCSWTIGKGRSDIDVIVIKFEPFDLGKHCFTAQRKYVEISDVNHQFKVKKCGRGRSLEVLIKRRSAVVRFYSEITCRWGPHSSCSHDSQNIRLSFYVISKKLEVPLLNNWTISLSSYNYDRITANWNQTNVRGNYVFGFLITCNSKQNWANEAVYAFGENSSTSATCNGLTGYTNYDVYVLVMLKNQETGTYTAYKSLMASITTPESFPSIGPQIDNSTSDITADRAVINWKPLHRKYTNGVLLGYTVQLYRYFAYQKEINTNDTSVEFKDLSPATKYRVEIRGYTAAGIGPYEYYSFSTRECGRTIERQLYGKIQIANVNPWPAFCFWKIIAPTPNTLIVFNLESLEIRCRDFKLSIYDARGYSEQMSRICGSKRSLTFNLLGYAELRLYSWTKPKSWSPHMSSSFLVLENGLGNFPPIKSWNISSSMKTSTSINVSWDKYPGNESVSKYFVICTARKVSFASTDGEKNSLVVQYLLKNTEYKVTVLAILGNPSCFNCARVDGTIFKSQEVIVKTRRDDVPSTPPQHVKAWTSGSTVVVSWKPVDKDFTNGVIVGYYVYYRKARWHSWGLPLKKVYIKPNKTKAYLKFSWSYERYWIEVSAATKFGEGPRSRKIYITAPLYVPTRDYTKRIWW